MNLATPARRLLVVAPSWVGDLVMSQVAYKRLRQLHPELVIDVLVPAYALSLMQRMPELRRVIASPLKHGELDLRAHWRCAKALRAESYDQALVFPRSLKSALIPWFARIPRRTGHLGESRYGLINDIRRQPPDKHGLMVDAYLDLVDGSTMNDSLRPGLSVRGERVAGLLAHHGVGDRRPLAAMMPGAEFGPSKQWPLASFREVAQQWIAQGYTVCVFGSAKDRAAGQTIAEGLGEHVHNLCGATALEDVIDLLSVCSGAVSNDSGLMHIAAAVGCPVTALFGATTPVYTPPLTDARAILYRGVSCSPCFERQCRYGHYDCLTRITPAQTLDEASRLMR